MKKSKIVTIIFLLVVSIIGFGKTDALSEVLAYDANKQFLGILLGKSGGNAIVVYMPSVSKNITIIYDVFSGNAKTQGGSLYFVSANCSGVPYVDYWVSNEIIENSEQYYTGEMMEPINIQPNSRLTFWNSVCEPYSWDAFVVPAQEMMPPITFPIALPLSFELETLHHGKLKKLKNKGDKEE